MFGESGQKLALSVCYPSAIRGLVILKREVDVVLRNDKWKHEVDEKGLVQSFSLEIDFYEAIDLLRKATKVERSTYGYEVFVKDDEVYTSIFFRFGNEKTNSREHVESFIRRNWEG